MWRKKCDLALLWKYMRIFVEDNRDCNVKSYLYGKE